MWVAHRRRSRVTAAAPRRVGAALRSRARGMPSATGTQVRTRGAPQRPRGGLPSSAGVEGHWVGHE